MPIITGQTAQASDFIASSSGAGDAGKVPKLNAAGKVDNSCLPVKFGGTGADGALSISSGTTTINLAGAACVVKNYTSISITGTAVLAFSNPHPNGTILVLKSQGNVTLTSSAAPMIDMSLMGASPGNAGNGNIFSTTGGGTGGYQYGNAGLPGGSGGVGPMVMTPSIICKALLVVAGAGGGSGGPGGGGGGGAGGGALVIECGGAWYFTTVNGISVAGASGGNGVRSGYYPGGGGGGGGGGSFVAVCNSITSNTGTNNASAGPGGGGAAAYSNFGSSGGGGGGGGAAGYGGAGGAGANNGSGGGGGGGGSGGAGYALVVINTEFL